MVCSDVDCSSSISGRCHIHTATPQEACLLDALEDDLPLHIPPDSPCKDRFPQIDLQVCSIARSAEVDQALGRLLPIVNLELCSSPLVYRL